MILFAFKLLTIFLSSLDHFNCDVNLSDYMMPLIALRLENHKERFCNYNALKFQEVVDFIAVCYNMHNIVPILCGHGVTSMSHNKKKKKKLSTIATLDCGITIQSLQSNFTILRSKANDTLTTI